MHTFYGKQLLTWTSAGRAIYLLLFKLVLNIMPTENLSFSFAKLQLIMKQINELDYM